MFSKKKRVYPVQETDPKQMQTDTVTSESPNGEETMQQDNYETSYTASLHTEETTQPDDHSRTSPTASLHTEETTQPDDHSRTSPSSDEGYREAGQSLQSPSAESELEGNAETVFLHNVSNKLSTVSVSDHHLLLQDSSSASASKGKPVDAFLNTVSNKHSTVSFSDEDQSSQDSSSANTPSEVEQPSRYKSDFKKLSNIGEGQYGKVAKCKHLMDKQEYAIKKIKIRRKTDEELEKILNEVRILAQLKHPGIVKYHTAWIEKIGHSWDTSNYSGTGDSISYSDSVEYIQKRFNLVFRSSTCSNPQVSGTRSVVVPTPHSNLGLKVIGQTSGTLYIQMELCSMTLEEWMTSGRNDSAESMAIFRQIVNALQYIHSRGIVHKDLKASNIFLTKENNCVKIGDFGVAMINANKGYYNDIEKLGWIFFKLKLFPQDVSGTDIDNALIDNEIPSKMKEDGPEVAKLMMKMMVNDGYSLADLLTAIDRQDIEKLREEKDIHMQDIEKLREEKDIHLQDIEKLKEEKDIHLQDIEKLRKEKDIHLQDIEKLREEKDIKIYMQEAEVLRTEKATYLQEIEALKQQLALKDKLLEQKKIT